jgi:hypothetical protein
MLCNRAGLFKRFARFLLLRVGVCEAAPTKPPLIVSGMMTVKRSPSFISLEEHHVQI